MTRLAQDARSGEAEQFCRDVEGGRPSCCAMKAAVLGQDANLDEAP